VSKFQQYDDRDRGALFRNDRKEDDNDPDYRGTLNVGGVEHWLNAWLRTSAKTGRKYMSLSVKPKHERVPDRPRDADGDQVPW
jgi:uncharacterized protein (DUF736 family)